MMTIAEINKILATCQRKRARQVEALDQTDRELAAWTDLLTSKLKQETKK